MAGNHGDEYEGQIALTRFIRAVDVSPEFAAAHYNLSFVLSQLGDFDGAFTWLNRAADEGPALATTPLLEEIMGPAFRDLRRDPRFERVRKRLGLSR